jgi:hypothetical protein
MLTRGADFEMAASMKEKVYCVLEHETLQLYLYILWHIYPFLGNDSEIENYTTAVARQQLSSDHVGTEVKVSEMSKHKRKATKQQGTTQRDRNTCPKGLHRPV